MTSSSGTSTDQLQVDVLM